MFWAVSLLVLISESSTFSKETAENEARQVRSLNANNASSIMDESIGKAVYA